MMISGEKNNQRFVAVTELRSGEKGRVEGLSSPLSSKKHVYI